MAMGGSMTDTTQASTRYTPSTRAPRSQAGALSQANSSPSRSPAQNRAAERSREGTLAPAMVSHSTPASSRSISGKKPASTSRIAATPTA